ncbi:hypothetical protein [Sinorhizobium meliloti]|uniref:hypothetical protein n=1 Tax=Rhizobium meliloti TaxID=382 RepID=UPI001F163D74|nr:hypothetical protein [Sinorhizobium meliloti]
MEVRPLNGLSLPLTADLGNAPEKDGYGYLYRGPTGMQLTARTTIANSATGQLASTAPNFVKDPDAVNTDPCESLVPLFYWDTRDVNRWADEGDAETITKKVNGGKNGLADRFDRLARISLVSSATAPTSLSSRLTNGCRSTATSGRERALRCIRPLWRSLPGEAAPPVPVPVTPPALVRPGGSRKRLSLRLSSAAALRC